MKPPIPQKSICIIPARGGSQRIPRKNIVPFKGKPMIAYSIQAAIDSDLFERVIVSTDDMEIADIATHYDAEVVFRPSDDGSTGTQEIAGRLLMKMVSNDPDLYCCVLYATCPMVTPRDLRRGLETLKHCGKSYVVSVREDEGVYTDVGCMYWGKARSFANRMPLENDHAQMVMAADRFLDINTPEDLATLESWYDMIHGVNNATQEKDA